MYTIATPEEQAAGEKHAVECKDALRVAIAAVVKERDALKAENQRLNEPYRQCPTCKSYIKGDTHRCSPLGADCFTIWHEPSGAAISAGKQGEGE